MYTCFLFFAESVYYESTLGKVHTSKNIYTEFHCHSNFCVKLLSEQPDFLTALSNPSFSAHARELASGIKIHFSCFMCTCLCFLTHANIQNLDDVMEVEVDIIADLGCVVQFVCAI